VSTWNEEIKVIWYSINYSCRSDNENHTNIRQENNSRNLDKFSTWIFPSTLFRDINYLQKQILKI
jgi:hypothetical protein